MKKLALYAACAATVLAACSSNEEESVARVMEAESISFGTYVSMNNASRALEKSSFATNDVINVNACQTTGALNGNFTNNFMVNEPLTKVSTGKWTYENSKFWPLNNTDRISFVASYPSIAPTIADGKCKFDFTVNDDANLQQDFMWSTITDAHRNDRNGTYQNGIYEEPATSPITNVVLHFKHALAKVQFNAKAATYYNGTTITVTDIVVNNLYGAGSYTLTPTLGKGTWAVSGEQTKDYVVLQNGTGNAIDTYYTSFGTSLLAVPQTLNTTEGTKSTVTIKYTVKYAAPALTVNEERTFDLAVTSLLNGNTWEQDKVYNYNFNIALDMITFDADISGWGSSDSPTFTVE